MYNTDFSQKLILVMNVEKSSIVRNNICFTAVEIIA